MLNRVPPSPQRTSREALSRGEFAALTPQWTRQRLSSVTSKPSGSVASGPGPTANEQVRHNSKRWLYAGVALVIFWSIAGYIMKALPSSPGASGPAADAVERVEKDTRAELEALRRIVEGHVVETQAIARQLGDQVHQTRDLLEEAVRDVQSTNARMDGLKYSFDSQDRKFEDVEVALKEVVARLEILEGATLEFSQVNNQTSMQESNQVPQTADLDRWRADLMRSLDMRVSEVVKNNIEQLKASFGGEMRQKWERMSQKLKDATMRVETAVTSVAPPAPTIFAPETEIDWAKWQTGGRVIDDFTTPGINTQWARMPQLLGAVFGVKPHQISKHPEVVIRQPDGPIQQGDCFAFAGQQGQLTLELPAWIFVRAIRIDHVPNSLTPSPDAAIKKFEVFTSRPPAAADHVDAVAAVPRLYSEEHDWAERLQEPSLFRGSFEFEYPRKIQQKFELVSSDVATRRIRIKILENWGNQQYTVIYRVKVFGDLYRG